MSKVDKPLPVVDIDVNLRDFFGNESGHQCLPNERNASFDYCYNYFQSFRERGEEGISEIASDKNLEMSCFQIAFYLASWGMLRGSAFLAQKSAAHYSDLIRLIAETPQDFWEIDIGDYGEKGIIDEVLLYEKKIREKVSEGNGKNRQASETLTTKIMLGVFGNIPAFDSYFLKGFGNYWVNEDSLERIYDFYAANKEIVDGQKIPTINFLNGKSTSTSYSQAKIIDMIFFMEGDKLFKAEAEKKKQMGAQNKSKL